MLVIGDVGLPIPSGLRRIDMALTPGIPAVADVLRGVLEEMQVEKAVIATEAMERNGGQLPGWCQLPVTPQAVSHEDFKRLTQQARVMVRTGECTPRAGRCGFWRTSGRAHLGYAGASPIACPHAQLRAPRSPAPRNHRPRTRLAVGQQHPFHRPARHGHRGHRLLQPCRSDSGPGTRHAAGPRAGPHPQHPPAQRPLRRQRGAAKGLAGRHHRHPARPGRPCAPVGCLRAELHAHRAGVSALSGRHAAGAGLLCAAGRQALAGARRARARPPFGGAVRAPGPRADLGRCAVGERLWRGVPRAGGRRCLCPGGCHAGPD